MKVIQENAFYSNSLRKELLNDMDSSFPDSKNIYNLKNIQIGSQSTDNLNASSSTNDNIKRVNKFLHDESNRSESMNKQNKDNISERNYEKFITMTKGKNKIKNKEINELPNLTQLTEIKEKLPEISNKNDSTEKNLAVILPYLPPITKKIISDNLIINKNINSFKIKNDTSPLYKKIMSYNLITNKNTNFYKIKNDSSPIKENESLEENKKLLMKLIEKSPEKKFNAEKFRNVHQYNLNILKKMNDKMEEIKLRASSSEIKNTLRPLVRLNKIKKYFKEIEKSENKYLEILNYYLITPGNSEVVKKCMSHRTNWRECLSSLSNIANFRWQQSINGMDFSQLSKNSSVRKIYNHFEFHSQISNKLNLFINLMKYCESKSLDIFQIMPLTILIQYDNLNYLKQFQNFKEFFMDIDNFKEDQSGRYKSKYSDYFQFQYSSDKIGGKTNLYVSPNHYEGKNIWLVKAIDLNRGRCIKLADSIERIENIIKKFYNGITLNFKDDEEEKSNSHSPNRTQSKYKTSTVILQKYIEKPLLYKNRKFDIRLWVLVTHKFEVYVFKEGHLKASSVPFDINKIDSFIHLTNYSVQKYNEEFSKHEIGNEISFEDYQDFLEAEYPKDIVDKNNIKITFKKMCEIVKITLLSVKDKINAFDRKSSYEIFGYDFILDSDFKPYLLEVNTNPGLEISSPLIESLVPRMIDDALRLTIDPIFNTKYSFTLDSGYQSPYPVKGYSPTENIWEFLFNLKHKN